jgi:hypothetical protein
MTGRLAVAAALAVGASLAGAADPPRRQDRTVTLAGCVRTGSASAVFLLRGATEPGRGGPPGDYLIAVVPAGVNLADRVNHRIEVAAVVTDPDRPPDAPPAANAAERALKRLTVRSLKELADKCGRESSER